MGGRKTLVITAYGHDKTVDKIAVSSFDRPDAYSGYPDDSNAERYCGAVNSLELKGDSWIYAKIISENTQYALDVFSLANFEVLLEMDDRAIQRVLREVDTRDLAKALKGAAESVQEKIFANMSNRAAQMLKEDMQCMVRVRAGDVEACREKIVSVINYLESTGEIIVRGGV
jgi:flagellar motor switch protein FliG